MKLQNSHGVYKSGIATLPRDFAEKALLLGILEGSETDVFVCSKGCFLLLNHHQIIGLNRVKHVLLQLLHRTFFLKVLIGLRVSLKRY